MTANMTASDALALQMAEGHRMLELVMADVSPVMLAWQPPGNALPIGSIYAHAIGLEDLYVQQTIQGQPLLWASATWAERLGHPIAPNEWNIAGLLPPDMSALAAYKRAVFANSLAFVNSLGADDLERRVAFPGSTWSMSVAQLVVTTIAHTTSHAGEIAMLKGIQGGTGLPY